MRKEASAAASLAAADPIVVTTPSETRAGTVVETVSSLQSQDKPQPKQAHVRGKSGQRQKMKDKYRDQGSEQITVFRSLILIPIIQTTKKGNSRSK